VNKLLMIGGGTVRNM